MGREGGKRKEKGEEKKMLEGEEGDKAIDARPERPRGEEEEEERWGETEEAKSSG